MGLLVIHACSAYHSSGICQTIGDTVLASCSLKVVSIIKVCFMMAAAYDLVHRVKQQILHCLDLSQVSLCCHLLRDRYIVTVQASEVA